MAAPEQEPVDNAMLLHQVVLNEHGAFFLLLPLICGLITLLLYLFLQSFSWDSNTFFRDRRQACQLKPKLPCPPETEKQLPLVEQLSKLAVRTQNQRSSGLGDDSEIIQQKIRNCEENINLQNELLEVYDIKKKFTELLKVEVEKSSGLENGLIIIQSSEVTIISDKEHMTLEVEKTQKEEGYMIENMSELQNRLDKVILEYNFEKTLRERYEKDLECSITENNTYKEVIERFWSVRKQAVGSCDTDKTQKKAAILLNESEGFWSYGETNKTLYDQASQARANLVLAQEELEVCTTSLAKLQAQIEEENCTRRKVEDALSNSKKQLARYVETTQSELKQLNIAKASLRHGVVQLLMENKSSFITLQEVLKELVNKEKPQNMENECDIIDGKVAPANGSVTTKEKEYSDDVVKLTNENEEALTQALHEKVAALLLLSQQEEHNLLVADNILALQTEISSYKNELMQVTSEKVQALMELAWLQREFLKLQETSKLRPDNIRKLSSGQWSPVSDHGVFFEDDDNLISFTSESPREPQSQVNLKNLWTRSSPDLVNRTKSLSSILSFNRNKETDVGGIHRLRAENASLRDSLRGIRHLCQSANRLRLTIARVAAESVAQTESSIQLAVEAVDGVISEALQLKVALHSSLPVDDLGWNSIGSPLLGPSEFGDREFFDGQMGDDLDIVSFFGVEIVRLVLLAAQLQKRFLGQNV